MVEYTEHFMGMCNTKNFVEDPHHTSAKRTSSPKATIAHLRDSKSFTTFLPLKVHGIFFICSRAANSAICGGIRPNVELIRDSMIDLFTCKYDKNPIKNESTS